VVSTFLQLARLLHDLYLPGRPSGSAMESVMIAAAIFLGYAEGRPFTVAKLAGYLGLAPTTVRNKLRPLLEGGVVERRRDGTNAMAQPRVNSPAIWPRSPASSACSICRRARSSRLRIWRLWAALRPPWTGWPMSQLAGSVEIHVRLVFVRLFDKRHLRSVRRRAAHHPTAKPQLIKARRPYVLASVASGSAASIGTTGEPLIDLLYRINATYRTGAVWVMSSTTANVVRKLKDGQGNFLWQPTFAAGQPETLLGYPVRIWEQMDLPTIANNHPIAFGNFERGYLLVDRVGLRITVDANITTPGRIKYFIRRREGGHVLNNDAIKFLKCALS
jgi:DNA-binding transcriptional ArsR family regulator